MRTDAIWRLTLTVLCGNINDHPRNPAPTSKPPDHADSRQQPHEPPTAAAMAAAVSSSVCVSFYGVAEGLDVAD
jgi:hypothetical protein